MERLYDMEAQIIFPGSPVCIPHWTQRTLPARLQACVQSECKSTSFIQEEYQNRSIPVYYLKDEEYFEPFKYDLLVTTTTANGCEEVLESEYLPGYDDDSQELFKKKYFMHSVMSKVLQSDMGKTIVRKYAPTLDTQAV